MTYKEILDREDTNGSTEVLYREGMFLKAYEHSAYLCHRYIHPFKLSRRFVKTVPFDHSVEEVDYCNWLEMAFLQGSTAP